MYDRNFFEALTSCEKMVEVGEAYVEATADDWSTDISRIGKRGIGKDAFDLNKVAGRLE
jgi:hypothetical protein